MTDDTLIEIQNAIIRKLAPWLVAGIVGSAAVGSTGYFRVNKFTHSDFQLEKEKLLEQIEHEQIEIVDACHKYVQREIQHAEILLRVEMPPEKTKAKIRNLESSAQRVDPEFQPVYEGW